MDRPLGIDGLVDGAQAAGSIVRAVDGLAWADGLLGAAAGELVTLRDRGLGLCVQLLREEVAVAALDAPARFGVGALLERTGRLADVPVGSVVLGRVIDPLGRPVDGDGALGPCARQPLRVRPPSPSAVARRRLSYLCTGCKQVDVLQPVVRGTSHAVVFPARARPALALQAILSQTDDGAVCVYVVVGRPQAEVARAVSLFKGAGVWGRTAVVSAPPSSPPGLAALAGSAGSAIATAARQAGAEVLLVYDDLNAQADAWTRLSAALRGRPAGIEAQGLADLLGRAGVWAEGSLTTLAMVADARVPGEAGSDPLLQEVAAAVDGQIVYAPRRAGLDLDMERVPFITKHTWRGLAALHLRQGLAIEDLIGTVGADPSLMDSRTRAQHDRGLRLVAALAQPSLEPVPIEEGVAVVYAVSQGHADTWAVDDIPRFERTLRDYLREHHAGLLRDLRASNRRLGPELDDALEALAPR
jgi:F-type H+-transporting ATPase subunit alpha